MFDRGSKYKNLIEVFGEPFCYRWFFPIAPKKLAYTIFVERVQVQLV